MRSSFLLFSSARLSAIYVVPFSPPRVSRDSTKTAIATIGRCSALRYDRNSKARSTKEICRIDNSPHSYSSPCCARSFLCSSLDFPPVRVHRIFILLKISHRLRFFVIQLSDEGAVSFLYSCSRSRFLHRLRT